MVLGTPESMPIAAARVLAAFRATLMIALFERVTEVLLPNPVDRAGANGLLHGRKHSVSTTLQKLRQESHHPMGDHMSHRGTMAEGLFREFVAVLSVRSKQYMTPPTPRTPNRAGGQDRLCGANPTPHHMSMPEYRQLFTADGLASYNNSTLPLAASGGSAPRRPPPPTGLNSVAAVAPPVAAPETPSSVAVAAFQNHKASTPGQHGVPFTAKAPSSTAAPATTPPTAATTATAVTHPPVTAPRSVILDYLMEHGICYAHVFSACRGQGRCRWRHDLLPASFYKDVPRPASRGPTHTRRVVAALTPAHYDTAVAMGLELHVSGKHQAAMMAGDIPMGPRDDADM
ncbi:unnamed protein product [Ectocarpus sp. CCAP 1310/34]|nr:unnamed protein product [Ectocarpus sp. CCAP 1310/34]